MTLINYKSLKTETLSGISVSIDYFQSCSTIICSGEGKISFSNLKKRLKRECQNSNDRLLNSIEFLPDSILWNRIISSMTEILQYRKVVIIGYDRINNLHFYYHIYYNIVLSF